ncbi:hypothetical protein ACFSF3_07305 [Vibrio chagasii]
MKNCAFVRGRACQKVDDEGISFSRAGQPVGRHGQGAGRCEPGREGAVSGVDDALSQHLFRIMVGPESDLTLTENAQPAIMANALATLRVMQKEGGFSAGGERRLRRRAQPWRI